MPLAAATVLSPEAAHAMTALQQAIDRGAYGSAVILADSAARLAPTSPAPAYQRGVALTALGRYDEAEAAFREVLAKDPAYSGAWFELGNLAFRKQQYQEALEAFAREEQLLLSLQQTDGIALQGLSATRLQMGRAATRLGDPARAATAFEGALQADSTFAEAHYELSQFYEDEGDLEHAVRYARQALRHAPADPDNLYALGRLLFRSGATEEALPYLEQAVSGRPWHHGSLYNLGQALVRIGRQDEAQRYLAAAEQMQALQTQIEQARLDAQQYPEQVEGWVELAGLYVQAGRYDEAETNFGIALRLAPHNLALRNDLANLYLLQGHYAAATRQFQTILEHDSTQADAWLNLGVAHAVTGETAAAERAWQQTLRYSPGHPEAKANLERLASMKP